MLSYQPQQQNDLPGGGSTLAGGGSGSFCSANHVLNSSGQALGANSSQQSAVDDGVKRHFQTREGTYKLMTFSDLSRPSRLPLNPHQNNSVAGTAPVKVSFVSLPDSDDPGGFRDYLCFNSGKEIYVYPYGGVLKELTDLRNPVDKRAYKGCLPTCHDFNQTGATPDGAPLLIGFTGGQLQVVDPFRKESNSLNKLYNEERLIEKTRANCVKWVPGSPNQFLSAHMSGHMYLYNEELMCGPVAPTYQMFKQGEGFSVYTCKAKSSRNPLYRWTIGETPSAVNELAFSPDGRLLAVVSQDGFLRIFNYHSMELIGAMRSYFGGLLCVSWSPDGKYLATGGEDDLVSVYSLLEKRIVCRGHGHQSWISQVAFDPYLSLVYGPDEPDVHLDSEEDLRSLNLSSAELSNLLFTQYQHYYSQGPTQQQPPSMGVVQGQPPHSQQHRLSSSFRFLSRRGQKESVNSSGSSLGCLSYRLGSVGHDTHICLWDLTEDVLKPVTAGRIRTSVLFSHSPLNSIQPGSNLAALGGASSNMNSNGGGGADDQNNGSGGGGKKSGGKSQKDENRGMLKNKRYFINLRGGGGDKHNNQANNGGSANNCGVNQKTGTGNNMNSPRAKSNSDLAVSLSNTTKLLGTVFCPRLQDVPVIEPIINKKIARERLSALVFREDTVVTACLEGFVNTWARPGIIGLSHQHSINSPNPGGSPHVLPGGTIV